MLDDFPWMQSRRVRGTRRTPVPRSKEPFDSAIGPAETPPMEHQQADALALIAETALHHGMDPGAPAERRQVVVHVEAPVLAAQFALFNSRVFVALIVATLRPAMRYRP